MITKAIFQFITSPWSGPVSVRQALATMKITISWLPKCDIWLVRDSIPIVVGDAKKMLDIIVQPGVEVYICSSKKTQDDETSNDEQKN